MNAWGFLALWFEQAAFHEVNPYLAITLASIALGCFCMQLYCFRNEEHWRKYVSDYKKWLRTFNKG